MTIPVTFPDGSIRDVPSALRQIGACDTTIGAGTGFRHEPLDCNAQWRFLKGKDGWIARPRHGPVAQVAPVAEEWWRGVAIMADPPRDRLVPVALPAT